MQEWKASEKEAQKMTRDGAISVNLVTGEATHISDRPPEQDYSSADETAGALNRAADEVVGHRERQQTKKARRKRRDTFREGEAARDRPSSRLQFSETDQAAPELKKAIRKSDKAADRLDAAKAAVPVKPPGREHGNPLSRPVQEIRSTLHGEVSKVEGDNSGVQAGHLGERQIEKAVGYGNRRFHQARTDRKLKPRRDVKQAEQAAVKANADFYWRKSVMENPQLASSNPISRLWQKRKLQKQYAAAYRVAGKTVQAGKTAEATAKAAKKTAQESKRAALFLERHWKGALIVDGIGPLLVMLLGSLQSCSSLSGGGCPTSITEAEKYLGYSYVWGGSSPETSLDCSGFVSYVLTNSGLIPLPDGMMEAAAAPDDMEGSDPKESESDPAVYGDAGGGDGDYCTGEPAEASPEPAEEPAAGGMEPEG